MLHVYTTSRFTRLRYHVLRSLRSILCRAVSVAVLGAVLVLPLLPLVCLMGGAE